MTDASRTARREVLFDGRVQGVGFRYTARHVAGRFRVTGYVRNLADGRVQVVAEGEPAEVERFVQEVAAEMAGYIRGTQSRSLPATGEFHEFDVRF
ncbi:MAG: acylphosphatase [Planctomycetia bacterium]|nr:acylphosphatase [Planctomycetia bacterium]